MIIIWYFSCNAILFHLIKLYTDRSVSTCRGRVTHMPVSKLIHYWISWWLVARSASNHYLIQWWFIVNWKLRNKIPVQRDTSHFMQEIISKVSSANCRHLSWLQCVKMVPHYQLHRWRYLYVSLIFTPLCGITFWRLGRLEMLTKGNTLHENIST